MSDTTTNAQDLSELKEAASDIRDATQEGENTAWRVGTLFVDLIDGVNALISGAAGNLEQLRSDLTEAMNALKREMLTQLEVYDQSLQETQEELEAKMAAVKGTLDLSELDLSDEIRLAWYQAPAEQATYYTVVDGNRSVGALIMHSDSMRHQLTQVLITNEMMADGKLTGEHTDTKVYVYRRNLGDSSAPFMLAKAAWSAWEQVVPDPRVPGPTVYLTQEEYDTLELNGEIDANTEYNIYQ